MSDILPPSPTDAPFGSYNWQDWYIKVRNAINAAATISWNQITDFTGSNLTQLVTRSHQSLQNILGTTTPNTAFGHVPVGGSTGQILGKNSITDYDYSWIAASGGSSGPCFRASLTTNSPFNAATFTKVSLNTIDFDTDSGWDTTNKRWVCPTGKAGYYRVQGSVYGMIQAQSGIYKNGVLNTYGVGALGAVGSTSAVTPVSDIIHLAVGDYVELWFFTTNASPGNLVSIPQATFLTLDFVHS